MYILEHGVVLRYSFTLGVVGVVGGRNADRKRTQKWHSEHRPWNYARKAAPKRRKTAKNRIRKYLQPKPEAEIWRKPRQ